MIKVVVSTCSGYEKFLNHCLRSLNFKEHYNDILVCKARCDPDLVAINKFFDGNKSQMCSSKNLYEYTAFNLISSHLDYREVHSDKYLFIHDTCWTTDSSFFWDKLNELDSETNDSTRFYYLDNSKRQNIGICSKEFAKEYGSQFNDIINMDKADAVNFETFPFTDWEKHKLDDWIDSYEYMYYGFNEQVKKKIDENYFKKCIQTYNHISLTDETNYPDNQFSDIPLLKLRKMQGHKGTYERLVNESGLE